MSKSAWLFLCLTLATGATGAIGLGADAQQDLQTSAFIASGVSASLHITCCRFFPNAGSVECCTDTSNKFIQP